MSRSTFLFLISAMVTGARPASAQANLTPAQKIAQASSAAPAALAEHATIMDWPAKEGGKMVTLRAGTNGWTCLPDMPMTAGSDPMCVDEQWMTFMGAMLSKGTPNVTRQGIGYMIAPGGGSASNTDPYATKATATNEWGVDPPHIMLLVPDPKALAGLPTKRQNGAPWVMWSGTPYAHIMVPVAPNH